jgi:sulfite exporter TauE/SafE
MITKPTYLVSIVGGIELSLSSIIFLVAEKIMLIACLSLIISSYFSTYDFKVPLLRSNFEKSLTRMVLYLDLVASM